MARRGLPEVCRCCGPAVLKQYYLRAPGPSSIGIVIGQGKKRFMEPEHGSAAIGAMRAIKRALDPDDIMNPGKIV
jgi:FAD/FMN-containing dehydrogenase